ncbi:MAG: TonB C-terminal domain-containing protein [Myxococcales bacterium]|nr:TonB C-terminal domain-containing protein [Myxococcales bacterium]
MSTPVPVASRTPGTPFRTALVPEKQSLLPFALVSAAFHAVAASSIWGVTAFVSVLSAFVPMCSTAPPPLTDAIEVSVVSLPKSKSKLPERGSHIERAAGVQAEAPPPPVQQSDLAYKTKVPDPKVKGNTDDSARQKMLEELKRQELLDALSDTPSGTVDRLASDPNGVDDLAIAALGAGSKGDPEFQRWVAQVQKLLMQHFKPISAITDGKPNLVCLVTIDMDPVTGAVKTWTVTEPSGIIPFDQAAERAISEIPSLPLPPEKYRPLVAEGVGFRFTPP